MLCVAMGRRMKLQSVRALNATVSTTSRSQTQEPSEDCLNKGSIPQCSWLLLSTKYGLVLADIVIIKES